MFYEDEEERKEIRDRADGIEYGINKGAEKFKIIEETQWEILEG